MAEIRDSGRVIVPDALRVGDKIAIVSPSGSVKREFVESAAQLMERRGFNVAIGEHALGAWHNFSACESDRIADFSKAWLDPSVKAVWCARGGFGAVQLLGDLCRLPLRSNAKWLLGYSDISALHALMHSHGIASLHAPMARHLAECGDDDWCTQAAFSALCGDILPQSLGRHPMNRCGSASGMLVGGNLAVLTALMATPFNIFSPGTILFIEDIGEPVYKIERMLWQLKYAGVLDNLSGLIVGSFTDCRAGASGECAYELISRIIAGTTYPVAMGAPVGHTSDNIPLVESIRYNLMVSDSTATLSVAGV